MKDEDISLNEISSIINILTKIVKHPPRRIEKWIAKMIAITQNSKFKHEVVGRRVNVKY